MKDLFEKSYKTEFIRDPQRNLQINLGKNNLKEYWKESKDESPKEILGKINKSWKESINPWMTEMESWDEFLKEPRKESIKEVRTKALRNPYKKQYEF